MGRGRPPGLGAPIAAPFAISQSAATPGPRGEAHGLRRRGRRAPRSRVRRAGRTRPRSLARSREPFRGRPGRLVGPRTRGGSAFLRCPVGWRGQARARERSKRFVLQERLGVDVPLRIRRWLGKRRGLRSAGVGKRRGLHSARVGWRRSRRGRVGRVGVFDDSAARERPAGRVSG